jgi:hypothetical protein
MPQLIGNYSNTIIPNQLTDLNLKFSIMEVIQTFQSDLIAYSRVIDARNNQRETKFEAFNPKYLEVSVSV